MRDSNRLLPLVVVMLAASCGKDGDPAAPRGTGPVTTEPAGAATKTLAAGGGSITATATSGITYVLEVPPGALTAPTAITMTPVIDIAELGLSGGLAGAVVLEPAGLTFARAAVLKIRTSQTAGAGQGLAGFTASADFTARSLSPAAAGDGEIAVLVPHFSVAGAGFGTTEDVSQFPAAWARRSAKPKSPSTTWPAATCARWPAAASRPGSRWSPGTGATSAARARPRGSTSCIREPRARRSTSSWWCCYERLYPALDQPDSDTQPR